MFSAGCSMPLTVQYGNVINLIKLYNQTGPFPLGNNHRNQSDSTVSFPLGETIDINHTAPFPF
jgi:hypothetical protein